MEEGKSAFKIITGKLQERDIGGHRQWWENIVII